MKYYAFGQHPTKKEPVKKHVPTSAQPQFNDGFKQALVTYLHTTTNFTTPSNEDYGQETNELTARLDNARIIVSMLGLEIPSESLESFDSVNEELAHELGLIKELTKDL